MDRGLTQVELADRAEIRRPWLSHIENGRALATAAELDAIAKALNTRPDSLYDEALRQVIYGVEAAS